MDSHRYSNERIKEDGVNNDASKGGVKWSPVKSIWITAMYVGAIGGGSVYFTWDALLLFFVTSGVTLCAGHSLGMHRKLIHQSFDCPAWLEKCFVYLGTLVGLGGPFAMTYTHDMRDWAQRQNHCHDFYGHRQSIFKDAWWQMHCDIHLDNPPGFIFDKDMAASSFYRFIDKTAMWQQLPWVLGFFILGGWGWVFWGVCARVAVGVTGHWLVGYFAHNTGGRHWHVDGACVQGYDVNFCGLITFGECWHNNHHAFPGSAKLGIYDNQMDPGWWLIKCFEAIGLVGNIKTNADLPYRPELIEITPKQIIGDKAYA
jgi:stearoyl-CoA desaturase (delta-9 desaturase)